MESNVYIACTWAFWAWAFCQLPHHRMAAHKETIGNFFMLRIFAEKRTMGGVEIVKFAAP